MASLKEIAELANISLGTVSLVLNGKGEQYRISQHTQQRIFEAAKQLDYQPNISARRLRSVGETVAPIIALFWTMDTRSQLMARYLKGVQKAVQQQKIEYEILIQPYIGSRLNEVRSLITGTRFNSAIIANPTPEDERFLEDTQLQSPIVIYQRDSGKYCSVNTDNYKAGFETAQLFASRGHTCVGMIVPGVSSSAIQLRLNGFRAGCAASGLHLSDRHIVYDDFSEQGGYNAARSVGLLSDRPTALFFLSDQMAVGGLYALHELGILVPENMEIVGHDDDAVSQFCNPSLTTVHLPVEQMAEACVELAIELMSHRISQPVTRKFESHLIVRRSCGGIIS